MPRLVWVLLLILCLALPLCAQATTLYIAPAGNDSAAGTQSAPWKTFGYALPKLQPGDTLVLLNGTYTVPANTAFYAGCTGSQYSSGAKDGTAVAPITVRAQHERQALIQGSGTNVVALDGCEYWVLEGLYIRNVDVQVSGWEGSGIVLQSSHHITLRRNLVYGPNAYFNSHGIALYLTHHSLLEENEVYYVARHGVILGDAGTPSDGNTLRRNYVHSRGHGDMPGGFTSAPGCGSGYTRGDEGISCYPCKNNIFENNIIEDFDSTFTIQCKQDCGNNKYYGNISLANGCGGIGFTARGESYPASATQMPTDELVVNHLTVNSTVAGGGCTSCKNLVVDHMTVVGNATGFGVKLGSAQYGEQGDGVSTFTGTNVLITGNQGVGFEALAQHTWSLDRAILFQNGGGYNPALSDPHYTHVSAADPQMGDCRVSLPASSPAKGVGTDGSDIGATILYRYHGGAITNIPLWDPATGAFPCGAVVPGVNDVAGKSCRDVHERLHVGTAGCPLPYGQTGGGTRLSWKAPADGGPATSYDITRNDALLTTVPATTLTYTDAQAGAACYTVTARNGAGATPTEPVCTEAREAPGMPQEFSVTPPARSRGEHQGRRP